MVEACFPHFDYRMSNEYSDFRDKTATDDRPGETVHACMCAMWHNDNRDCSMIDVSTRSNTLLHVRPPYLLRAR